jgi:hypothetical protein
VLAVPPTKRQSAYLVVDHLIGYHGVLFREARRNGLEARMVFESSWPIDRYFRYWWHTIFRTEGKVLSRLYYCGPLNRYKLADLEPRMHYNAVRRAVKSLLKRKAIKPDSSKEWRTGKISTKYSLTPFGRFLYLLGEARDILHIHECLLRLAKEDNFKLLGDLANCIMRISDADRRKRHLHELLNIILEAPESFSRASWRFPLAAQFIFRVCWDSRDIVAYRGHLPYECRFLLFETKKELLACVEEIDSALTSNHSHHSL